MWWFKFNLKFIESVFCVLKTTSFLAKIKFFYNVSFSESTVKCKTKNFVINNKSVSFEPLLWIYSMNKKGSGQFENKSNAHTFWNDSLLWVKMCKIWNSICSIRANNIGDKALSSILNSRNEMKKVMIRDKIWMAQIHECVAATVSAQIKLKSHTFHLKRTFLCCCCCCCC